ncbi:hypothetical protein L5515_018372 [Caenorhabditis briggsae]|uniref:C3H1-type domain-containing protein n=1 Tax=Caenorhabditis briggsae TaxID=6238 RepID=A0AAE9JRI4_CAEBR|nr:hypothetical protein L5515_018372 [Caenorhabditis briggsae]
MELSSLADDGQVAVLTESNRSGSDPKPIVFNAGQPPSRRHSMTETQRQNSVGSGGQQQNSSPSPDVFLQEKLSHQHYLNEFRVEACPLFKQHQCQQHRPFTCFKWHFANQRRRRPVKRSDGSFNYSPDIYCDKYDENTGICPDGDDCIFLHRVSGDVERKYHLRYYKTAQCVHPTDSRGQCVKNGAHCAFAHTANDIRPPMFDQHEVGFATVVDGETRDKTSFVIEDPQWHFAAQDHVLSCYKTEQCRKPARLCRQGYACPFYHNSKDRRRPPALYKYRSTPCPAAKTIDEWLDPDICEAGDSCQYCHTRTEQQFHPEIYKSTKCNDMLEHGYCPRAVFCAFAHHDSELHAQRNPYVGSTQPSPKEQCSPSPNGFSIPTEQMRFESPTNNAPSYSSVLKTRVPVKQGYATTDSISSSYPKAPGFERSPIAGSFEFQPLGRGDQRLRTHSLNMGHLDMLKRTMIISGGLQSLDSGNPALTSHSSLCRSDSGFNVVTDSSLPTLDELSLDLPRIDETGNQFNLFNDVLSSVRNASLDPYENAGFFGQPETGPQDIFGGSFEPQMFGQEYQQQDGYGDYVKPMKGDDFGSLSEKCQYLEDSLKQSRQSEQMWRMRYEGEFVEKSRLLQERNNLLGQLEQMKHQLPQFMPPVQMSSPLSISLPQDNYDGGIRPSASLQHSPPYNIFGNDCDTGAPACARCGRDRSRTGGFDSQSSCPVCSN